MSIPDVLIDSRLDLMLRPLTMRTVTLRWPQKSSDFGAILWLLSAGRDYKISLIFGRIRGTLAVAIACETMLADAKVSGLCSRDERRQNQRYDFTKYATANEARNDVLQSFIGSASNVRAKQ